MTKAKFDNSLYTHLESEVNQALRLEYAIRAAQQANPQELVQLAEIDIRIRQHWRDLGASDEEINGEQLIEFAWDTIQVGFPMSRRHNRLYSDRSFLQLLDKGLTDIPKEFGKTVDALLIPATNYFRICDLLNGNNIVSMMKAVAQCLVDAKEVEKRLDLSMQERKLKNQQEIAQHEFKRVPNKVDIDLEKFVRGIRTPIHLHPGMHYVSRERPNGPCPAESFGILLDTDADFTVPDLYRQVREFLYQFAVRRQSMQSLFVSKDNLPTALIQAFLIDGLLGKIETHKAARLDGLIGPLAGLHCWDLARKYEKECNVRDDTKSPIDIAIDEALNTYPKSVRKIEWDAMRKNYYRARKEILGMPFMPA